MSKKISLVEYIYDYNTELNNKFKQKYDYFFLKLLNENNGCMMSSKKFLNLSKNEGINDVNFLKSVYNEYFDHIMNNL